MFHFKKFDLEHDKSTLKIGTDAVLLAAATETTAPKNLLDIGCGCGVIAFCLAQKIAENNAFTEIYGIDIDANSIIEAKENARNFKLLPEKSFHFEKISLQEFANEENNNKFDLIVSNPPFFHNSLKPENEKRLKSRHSDEQLSFSELIDNVIKLLSPNGRFAVILPKAESEEFHKILNYRLFRTKTVEIKSVEHKPVFRIISEYSKIQTAKTEATLTIRNSNSQYTDEYLALVKPFLTIS